MGFAIDTTRFLLSVPDHKLGKLLQLAKEELTRKQTTARRVAKVAGQIVSMEPGIGPLARLFTRKMYQFIDNCPSWDGRAKTEASVQDEIAFWINNINKVNGYHIKQNHAVTKIVYSDASDHAYGGFIAEKLGNVIARGSFTEAEAETSSTYRELLAVKHVLNSLSSQLAC